MITYGGTSLDIRHPLCISVQLPIWQYWCKVTFPLRITQSSNVHSPAIMCDLCGGKTVIRKDDQPATVLDRLKAYHEQTEPLVEFYRTRGKLAEIKFCPSIEETTAEVMKALEA